MTLQDHWLNRRQVTRLSLAGISSLVAALSLTCGQSYAADKNLRIEIQEQRPSGITPEGKEKEQDALAVLNSDRPRGEKALACKRLAVWGSDQAVPVLASLLADPELASWARIPLEAIPGEAADKALRDALGKLQGRLLIGTINSIGVRRDAKAVDALALKLKDTDAAVACAAAESLGRIGGDQAAKSLRAALPKSPADVKSTVAEGCIRCAERWLAEGRAGDAAKLYDFVRKAPVANERILEANRGAILARRDKGVPMLAEQMRSADKAVFNMALHTARELPGSEATKVVAAEFQRASAERQPMLLLALAERNDPGAMPTLLEATRTGSRKVQLVAISMLERSGDPKSLPVLLEAATSQDKDLAGPAKTAIVRLPGTEPDAELMRRFPPSSGKLRQVLIELCALRRVQPALPAIVACAEDSDPATRTAAVQAIGILGDKEQVNDIVRLLQQSHEAKDRQDLEAALLALSSQAGAGAGEQLRPLVRSSDSGLRIIGVHALAAAGGPEALAAVKSATDDKDEAVQDEAVRTLSTWPNTWPEDSAVAQPLLDLAKSGKKTTHQVLALRGYLQFVQRDKKLSAAEKAAKLNEVAPLLQRPEEKRLAISVAREVPHSGSLALLSGFADQPDIADDACAALVEVAGKSISGVTTEERQKALQAVMDKCGNDATKKKAEAALKKLQ